MKKTDNILLRKDEHQYGAVYLCVADEEIPRYLT
jgi:hypothetical protein